MRSRIVVCLLIACFGACNQRVNEDVVLQGQLMHYKGDKVYFEMAGVDSLLSTPLDSTGCFFIRFPLERSIYVRVMNGKATFPLYLAPGVKVRMEMDVDRVKQGEYGSVVFPDGINKETRMMVQYYENQWFPSTQEMFVYPPEDFKKLMDSLVSYNDRLIDDFLVENPGEYDRRFVDLFKIQIKVPFAMSYFYYPAYHALLNPEDDSEIPADFNIFDTLLPKNDSIIYQQVYRYKTYEVSYWNQCLLQELSAWSDEPAQFFELYLKRWHWNWIRG